MAEENTAEETAARAATAEEEQSKLDKEEAEEEEAEASPAGVDVEQKDPSAAAAEDTAADPTEPETKETKEQGDDDDAPSTTEEVTATRGEATESSPAQQITAIEQGTFGVAVGAATAASQTEVPIAEDESKKEEDVEEEKQQAFVNRGLAAWEQSRQQWLNHREEGDRGREQQQQLLQRSNNPHAVPVNVDEIIDVVFASPRQLRANGGKGRNFPQPVALPQMIDILQDLWEAEGLDV